jgi:hypothetical protein
MTRMPVGLATSCSRPTNSPGSTAAGRREGTLLTVLMAAVTDGLSGQPAGAGSANAALAPMDMRAGLEATEPWTALVTGATVPPVLEVFTEGVSSITGMFGKSSASPFTTLGTATAASGDIPAQRAPSTPRT